VIAFQFVFEQQKIYLSEEEYKSAKEDAIGVLPEDIEWHQGWL